MPRDSAHSPISIRGNSRVPPTDLCISPTLLLAKLIVRETPHDSPQAVVAGHHGSRPRRRLFPGRAVAGDVMRRDAEAGVVRRRHRRSIVRLARAGTLGGHGAERHGDDEPAARGTGRPRHPEARRQRDRCRGRHRRGAQRRRTDETGVAGDLFAIIYIAKENKLYTLNASGKAPTRADARAHECARLHLESEELGRPAPACRAAAS